MEKKRLLDLYSGAGGCARGYQRAGFYVVGVDIEPMPRYCGDEFVQSDALQYLSKHAHEFDAIHASPPCHHYSTGTKHRKNAGIVYPDLLGLTQTALRWAGKPYVIENVPGAKDLLSSPIMLCGGMFGLGVRRHRFFELSFQMDVPEHRCNRDEIDADEVSVTRHGPPARWYRANPGATFSIKTWHKAMGIDWMNRQTLTQAIPPAYTECIGKRLMAELTL